MTAHDDATPGGAVRDRAARSGGSGAFDPVDVLTGQVVAGYANTETAAGRAAEPPLDPLAAAFFDVDNTLIRGASIYWFARGMASRDYVTSGELARFAWSQLKFRVLATEAASDVARAKGAALSFIKGFPVRELEDLCEEIFDELMAEKIWTGTLELAREHITAGQRVWLVTAAPIELGRVIADRLGLTGALGTVAEKAGGVYTGALVGDLLHGPAKADAIQELAAVHGLDLHRCAAYSDSINDVPMLSTVGRAVAVNPDARLRREAERRGWQVLDFRTGRRVAKVAVPTALGVAAAVGAAAVTVSVRRHRPRR